jgi:hypothetical protein
MRRKTWRVASCRRPRPFPAARAARPASRRYKDIGGKGAEDDGKGEDGQARRHRPGARSPPRWPSGTLASWQTRNSSPCQGQVARSSQTKVLEVFDTLIQRDDEEQEKDDVGHAAHHGDIAACPAGERRETATAPRWPRKSEGQRGGAVIASSAARRRRTSRNQCAWPRSGSTAASSGPQGPWGRRRSEHRAALRQGMGPRDRVPVESPRPSKDQKTFLAVHHPR